MASWKPCVLLTGKAERLAESMVSDVSFLLQVSTSRLGQDPLTIDFSLHRWLARDREEAYSDWLKWVLEELCTPLRVGYVLFGTDLPSQFRTCRDVCTVEREVWVEKGHEGRLGRLDLVVRFGDKIVIVIEVKVIGADSADTVKQSGYREWIDRQPADFRSAILLAVGGEAQKEYEGFQLLLWETFCVRLRHCMSELTSEGRMISSALIAGFTGAAEQNLLGLPSLRRMEQPRRPLLFMTQLAKARSYLRCTLKGYGVADEPS
ncbi:MAG: hypothetical protein E8D52_01505 [Nitrospira sp.]|nr:MAG: hypothetical protein E8D52_01505 [Nitrospira sp.]